MCPKLLELFVSVMSDFGFPVNGVLDLPHHGAMAHRCTCVCSCELRFTPCLSEDLFRTASWFGSHVREQIAKGAASCREGFGYVRLFGLAFSQNLCEQLCEVSEKMWQSFVTCCDAVPAGLQEASYSVICFVMRNSNRAFHGAGRKYSLKSY